jgi:hypothetical protein
VKYSADGQSRYCGIILILTLIVCCSFREDDQAVRGRPAGLVGPDISSRGRDAPAFFPTRHTTLLFSHRYRLRCPCLHAVIVDLMILCSGYSDAVVNAINQHGI